MKKIVIFAAVLASVLSFIGCNKKTEAGEFTVEKGKFKVGMEMNMIHCQLEIDGFTYANTLQHQKDGIALQQTQLYFTL